MNLIYEHFVEVDGAVVGFVTDDKDTRKARLEQILSKS